MVKMSISSCNIVPRLRQARLSKFYTLTKLHWSIMKDSLVLYYMISIMIRVCLIGSFHRSMMLLLVLRLRMMMLVMGHYWRGRGLNLDPMVYF